MEKVLEKDIANSIEEDWIFVIYDIDSVYLRDCKTLAEVAKYFKISKQAISNHLRRTNQSKENFTYRGHTIEYFDRNNEDC